MTQPSPPASGFFLRRAVLAAAGAEENAAEGEYSPTQNARNLALGRDHRAPVARMVALHEAFHAILNGSTTFGSAMVIAGALEAAGEPEFGALIERMIGGAVVAHETYATLASIYAVAEGVYDRSLLADYPDYLRLYDNVANVLDLTDKPFVCSVCIESAARAALQTTLLEAWRPLPCPDWAQTSWPLAQTPDKRFAKLMQAPVLRSARDAVDHALRTSPEPLLREVGAANLDPQAVTERLRGSAARALDAINQAAFDTLAVQLAADDAPRPTFDQQRLQARDVIAQVTAYAGDRLKTEFYVPDDLHADRAAVLQDFRRERVILRPRGQGADLAALAEVEPASAQGFAHRLDGLRYVQLVALPSTKARRLYRFGFGAEHLDQVGDTLTAVRRRLAPDAARPAGLVEIIALDAPADLLLWTTAEPPAQVHATVSASTLYETPWARTWLTAEDSRIDALAVLMDIDPFHLAEHMANSSVVALNRASLLWDEPGAPERLEVIVLTTEARPEVVHFTPCSGPLMDAMIDHLGRALPETKVGGGLDERQSLILKLALSHAVREEPMFGFDF